MAKCRCLFILEEARLGGPQIYVVNLISALKSKCESVFIFPEHNSSRLKEVCISSHVLHETISIHTLSLKISAILIYLVTFVPDIIRTMRRIKAHDPNIVYVAGGSWQFKSIIAAFCSQKKTVWHLNDSHMHPIILIVFKVISRFVVNFVYASQRTKVYYKKLIKNCAQDIVIPSPVANIFFDHPCKNILEIKDSFKVVTIANVNPVKGFSKLVDIAKVAKSQKLNLEFYVVGEVFDTQKKYYEKIKESINTEGLDNIKFLGPSEQVKAVLCNMDAYLCTSVSESSPIAVWEAMAIGLPVVSTDVGDVGFFIDHYEIGYVYKTAEQACTALSQMSENSQIWNDRSNAAKICAAQNFTSDKCAELHLLFFEEVLKDPR